MTTANHLRRMPSSMEKETGYAYTGGHGFSDEERLPAQTFAQQVLQQHQQQQIQPPPDPSRVTKHAHCPPLFPPRQQPHLKRYVTRSVVLNHPNGAESQVTRQHSFHENDSIHHRHHSPTVAEPQQENKWPPDHTKYASTVLSGGNYSLNNTSIDSTLTSNAVENSKSLSKNYTFSNDENELKKHHLSMETNALPFQSTFNPTTTTLSTTGLSTLHENGLVNDVHAPIPMHPRGMAREIQTLRHSLQSLQSQFSAWMQQVEKDLSALHKMIQESQIQNTERIDDINDCSYKFWGDVLPNKDGYILLWMNLPTEESTDSSSLPDSHKNDGTNARMNNRGDIEEENGDDTREKVMRVDCGVTLLLSYPCADAILPGKGHMRWLRTYIIDPSSARIDNYWVPVYDLRRKQDLVGRFRFDKHDTSTLMIESKITNMNDAMHSSDDGHLDNLNTDETMMAMRSKQVQFSVPAEEKKKRNTSSTSHRESSKSTKRHSAKTTTTTSKHDKQKPTMISATTIASSKNHSSKKAVPMRSPPSPASSHDDSMENLIGSMQEDFLLDKEWNNDLIETTTSYSPRKNRDNKDMEQVLSNDAFLDDDVLDWVQSVESEIQPKSHAKSQPKMQAKSNQPPSHSSNPVQHVVSRQTRNAQKPTIQTKNSQTPIKSNKTSNDDMIRPARAEQDSTKTNNDNIAAKQVPVQTDYNPPTTIKQEPIQSETPMVRLVSSANASDAGLKQEKLLVPNHHHSRQIISLPDHAISAPVFTSKLTTANKPPPLSHSNTAADATLDKQ